MPRKTKSDDMNIVTRGKVFQKFKIDGKDFILLEKHENESRDGIFINIFFVDLETFNKIEAEEMIAARLEAKAKNLEEENLEFHQEAHRRIKERIKRGKWDPTQDADF